MAIHVSTIVQPVTPAGAARVRRFANRAYFVLATAVVYFLAAETSFSTQLQFGAAGSYTVAWPASAIALAALIRFGPSLAFGVALGSAAVFLRRGLSPGYCAFAMAGETLSALAGATLLERVAAFNRSLRRLRDVASFLFFALVMALAAGSALSSLGYYIYFGESSRDFFETWVDHFLESASGDMVLAPLLFVPWREIREPWTLSRTVEGFCAAAVLLLSGYVAFFSDRSMVQSAALLPFATFPPLIWCATRFGLRGATLSAVLVGCMAIGATMGGRGLFASEPSPRSLLNLHGYLAVVGLAALFIAASLAERIDAQVALREGESKYRNILETSTALIWSVDNRNRITYVNQASKAVYGYAPGEMLGKSIVDILTPERAAADLATFEKIKSGQPHFHYETVHRRKDGSPVELSLNAIRLCDAAGRMVGVTGTATDITEIKRSERALRESESRFRTMIQSSPLGISIDREGVILFVNHAFLRMFGLASPDDAVGRLLYQFVPPGPDAPIAAAPSAPRAYESIARRQDGSRLPLLVQIETMELNNGPAHVAFLIDLTERHRIESDLRQAQKMEAVGRLAGGVAHDFNNLLTVIIGHCDLLAAETARDPALLSRVQEVRRAADRAAALTRQLLAFGRKQVLQPVTLDLNEIVAATSRMLARVLTENIEIRTELSPALDSVRADPTQIDIVLLNLIVNARDSMPQGGKITIRTYNVANPAEPSPFVVLSVADTGIGMDSDTRAHMFEPFFTTKPGDKGTGLGLATVYAIVQQSGGRIDVESAPGAGTCIAVHLPSAGPSRVASPAREAPGGPQAPAPGGRETVLLVEDDDALRALAAATLESHGYKVLSAASCDGALDIAGRHRHEIRLLISDVILPGTGGLELARRVESIVPGIRTLHISGHSNRQLPELVQYGAVFLQKPFTPSALLHSARAALDRTGREV
jgi:PAS domain S-box-containing protein